MLDFIERAAPSPASIVSEAEAATIPGTRQVVDVPSALSGEVTWDGERVPLRPADLDFGWLAEDVKINLNRPMVILHGSEPDPDWTGRDAAGHAHRMVDDVYPTLETRTRTVRADDDEWEEDYFVCRECGVEVRPGWRPKTYYVPGRWSGTLSAARLIAPASLGRALLDRFQDVANAVRNALVFDSDEHRCVARNAILTAFERAIETNGLFVIEGAAFTITGLDTGRAHGERV